MRMGVIVAAALMLASGPAQAQSSNTPLILPKPAPHRPERQAAIVPAALVERQPEVTRGQIVVCANLAAQRALDAQRVGAGYAAQDRILDVTFVLCMAGPQTAD